MSKLLRLASLPLKPHISTYLISHVGDSWVAHKEVSVLILLLHRLRLPLMRNASLRCSWRKPYLPRMVPVSLIIDRFVLDRVAAQELQFILEMGDCFILFFQGFGLKDRLSLLLG